MNPQRHVGLTVRRLKVEDLPVTMGNALSSITNVMEETIVEMGVMNPKRRVGPTVRR